MQRCQEGGEDADGAVSADEPENSEPRVADEDVEGRVVGRRSAGDLDQVARAARHGVAVRASRVGEVLARRAW